MILFACLCCRRMRFRWFAKEVHLSQKALSDAIGNRANKFQGTEEEGVDLLICSRCHRLFTKYLDILTSMGIAKDYKSPSHSMWDYSHEDAASAAFFALVESNSPGHDVGVRRSLAKPNETDEFVVNYKGVHSWWCVRIGEGSFVSHRWYM